MILSFDEWYAQNEEKLYIIWAESGRDRELCFNADDEFEKAYDEYVSYEENKKTYNDDIKGY